MDRQLLEANKYDVDAIIQNSIFNIPTIVEGLGEIYPIKVKDCYEFNKKYNKYIILNHDYIGIPQSESLLQNLIMLFFIEKKAEKIKDKNSCNGVFQTQLMDDPISMMDRKEVVLSKEEEDELLIDVLEECRDMFAMLFKKKITMHDNEIVFEVWVNDKISMPITDRDFMILRQIVMIQNGFVEPHRYQDPIVEEWMSKARNARKRHDITFNDMLIFVKNETHATYDSLYNAPLISFYSDYHNIIHTKSYDASILFRTVSNDYPVVQYIGSTTKELFHDGDEDLTIELESITEKLD